MTGTDEQRVSAVCSAREQRWYNDLIQHAETVSVPTVDDPPTAKPVESCLLMRGDATLDGRVEDINGDLWSDDLKGRWFATIDRKKVWLHHRLAWIQDQREPRAMEVVSHLCGFCDCVRLQHIRIQPKSEDVLDRIHHRAHGPGHVRPRKRAPESPLTGPSVSKHRRVMSP